jgi:hypothetical protein
MWLILCSAQDAVADWARRGLASRGLAPLEVVYAEALPYSLRWEHRIGEAGAYVGFELRDGRRVTSDCLNGVLNRLTHVPTQHLSMLPDLEYISQEMTAFSMSWLYALPCPVLNRPTAQGLCGPWLHVSEWVVLAARAGLPTPVYRHGGGDYIDETKTERTLFPHGTTTGAIVCGGRVFGPHAFPREIEEGCVRLSALVSMPLLGVEFGRGESGEWQFASATPLPDLSAGGEPLLDALAEELGASKTNDSPSAEGAGAAREMEAVR